VCAFQLVRTMFIHPRTKNSSEAHQIAFRFIFLSVEER
jgi:hypothetical protein